jgi:hypothetical protein
VIFSFVSILATNNANAGTNEKIVWAIEGSIRDTVNNDNDTPSVGPKIVPAIAYLIPPSLFSKSGCRTVLIFPRKIVSRYNDVVAMVSLIKVA